MLFFLSDILLFSLVIKLDQNITFMIKYTKMKANLIMNYSAINLICTDTEILFWKKKQ